MTNIALHEMFLHKSGSRVSIGHKYDSWHDFWLVFDYYGSNKIYSFFEWRIASNRDKTIDGDSLYRSALLQGEGSDWIGPIIVEALEFPSAPATFTGGNHAFDGGVNGSATSYTMNIDILMDGKHVKDDVSHSCSEVVIRVTNEVQAFNTKKEDGSGDAVLRETVIFIIRCGTVKVQHEMIMLKEAKIYKYYGLQTVNSFWNKKILYGDPHSLGHAFPSFGNNDSGRKSDHPEVDRFLIKSQDGKHEVLAWLDRDIGLGKLEWLSDELPVAFTMNYGKSYFNLINGTQPIVRPGDVLHWSGGYIFRTSDPERTLLV